MAGDESNKLPKIIDRKIDVGKAITMRFAQGMTLKQIADHFNVKEPSVHAALEPFKRLLKDNKITTAFTANQVQILEAVLVDLTSKLNDPDKLKKASLNNVAFAYDKIFQSLRLLKGQSTSNIEHAHHYEKNMAELDQEIAELEGTINPGMSEEEQITKEIEQLEENLKVEG